MIIAMAGLPGTGKSALARELVKRTGGVLYDKDAIREFLFPGELTDFSEEQNDICVEAMLSAAMYLVGKPGSFPVFLDGRTFSTKAQVDKLAESVGAARVELKIIECLCSDETARRRIEGDIGKHVARNRDFDLYLKIKRNAEPIEIRHLRLETDRMSIEESARAALEYIGHHD
jgi:predicted kinase